MNRTSINFSNLFTYYEQDMAKFIFLFDHYNNTYQGWYEKWQIMTIVKRKNEWLKEIITCQMKEN